MFCEHLLQCLEGGQDIEGCHDDDDVKDSHQARGLINFMMR